MVHSPRVLPPLLLAFLALSCAGGPRRPPEPKRIKSQLVVHSFVSSSGARVELVAGPCGPDVAIALLFEVGADHDPPGHSGMARLIARALSGPARTATAGRDHTVISSVVSRDALLGELDRTSALVGGLELDEAALETARSALLEDLASAQGGDAALTAATYAAESMLPTRGGGWRAGVASELASIDLADVRARWRAHYGAASARLVVVGSFDPFAARARVSAGLADAPAGTTPALRDPPDSTVTGTIVMGDAPSAVAVAVAAPEPTDPSYPAFLVLAARLLGADAVGARYDPVGEPELLFLGAPSSPGEPPDPAAAALRARAFAILERPLLDSDLVGARERFGALLGLGALEPAVCGADPRTLAVARARRAQLGLGSLPLAEGLAATGDAELREVLGRFETRRSAAVVAGGTIR